MPSELMFAFWGVIAGGCLTLGWLRWANARPADTHQEALPEGVQPPSAPIADSHVLFHLQAARTAMEALIAKNAAGPTARHADANEALTRVPDAAAQTLVSQAQELQAVLSQFDAWLNQTANDNEVLRDTITQVATATTRMDSRWAAIGPVFNEAALLCTASNDHLQALLDLSKNRRQRLFALRTDWQASGKVMVDFALRLEDMQRNVQVVQEAATKAKLLSLNAAIVASQSGEHGRGFSVVADQIKSLSVRTQAAAQGMEHCVGQIAAHKHQLDLLGQQFGSTLAEGHTDHAALEQRTLEAQTTNTALRHLLELRVQAKDDGALAVMNDAVAAMVQDLLNFNGALRVQAKDARRATTLCHGLSQSVSLWGAALKDAQDRLEPQRAAHVERAHGQSQLIDQQATKALFAIHAALKEPVASPER